jgi:hypothetical protein
MSRDKARLNDDWDDEQRQDPYYVPTIPAPHSPRPRRPLPSPQPRPRHRSPQPRQYERPRKRRSVWPWLLMGCAGGIVILVAAAAVTILLTIRSATGGSIIPVAGNPTTYTQQSQPQPVQLSTITQMQVHNQIGNITITVDPAATTPTIVTLKKVKAASSDAANKEFANISVQVQPTGSSLIVTATVPDTGNIFGSHNDSVDLTITLPPQSVNPTATSIGVSPTPTSSTASATSPLALNADVSIGDIAVDGLSGVLQLKDDVGNIKVDHATLSDGSHLETGTGNVTFNGNVDPTPATNNSTPRYKLQSETGNIDVTLPGDANIILDANTNAGNITSDFPITVKPSDNSANYYGPLNSNSTSGSTQPVLTLDVSTGNISLHRA